MISKNQKQILLKSLLSNSLPVLCKNGLGIPDVQFSVEAFVGITVGEGEEVILVSIKETVTSDGVNLSHVWSSPHEESANMCINSIIKQEINASEVAHESEVCDLTEEPDEINEEVTEINEEGFNFQNANTDDNTNFVPPVWMVKDERINAKPSIKKEKAQYDSRNSVCDTMYTGDDEINKEGEEDFSFSPNYTQHRSKSFLKRLDNNVPRLTKGGRTHFMQRGRFKRLSSGSYHAGPSSAPNVASTRDQSACDSLILRSGDVAYQDLMKEMCEQVVSQSMSMETQYVCHICHARRCSKSSLMDHIRGTHLAMDKYTCRECGERFRWFMQLHRHRKKFHPEPGDDQTVGDGDYTADDDGGNY